MGIAMKHFVWMPKKNFVRKVILKVSLVRDVLSCICILFHILILLYLVMKCVHTVIIVCITQAPVCSVKIVTWKSNSFCIQTLKQSYKCKQQLQNMTLEQNIMFRFSISKCSIIAKSYS